MKYKFSDSISISIVKDNVFIFNEVNNEICCVTEKGQKDICLHIYKNLPLEIMIDSDKLSKVDVYKLYQKGFLVKVEE